MAAMPPATGYVGIDLVLGRDPHGDEDAEIEINPRLTTSYLGVRAAVNNNLAEAIIRGARGETGELTFRTRPLEFDAAGNVSYVVTL